MNESDTRKGMAAAFTMWSDVSPFSFREVPDDQEADIKIGNVFSTPASVFGTPTSENTFLGRGACYIRSPAKPRCYGGTYLNVFSEMHPQLRNLVCGRHCAVTSKSDKPLGSPDLDDIDLYHAQIQAWFWVVGMIKGWHSSWHPVLHTALQSDIFPSCVHCRVLPH